MHKLLPGVIRSKPEPKEDHCLSLTLGTQQQKHLEVQQKYSAARRIYNSLLGVWKCDQIQSVMFDMLLLNLINNSSCLSKANHDREGGLDTRSKLAWSLTILLLCLLLVLC